MFGRMTILPVLQLNPNSHLEAAVAALLQAAEQPQIVRWIEFPNSVLLFAIVSGKSAIGRNLRARSQKRDLVRHRLRRPRIRRL